MVKKVSSAEWAGYVHAFHDERAGITERILASSVDEAGVNPYQWIAELVPEHGFVVDVACGSSPLWSPRLAGRYLGIDASASEVAAATRRGASDVVVGSASDIPAEDNAADVVVCSMALMVVSELPRVLSEIQRVLRSGGLLIATVPGGPLAVKDAPVVTGLIAALGRIPAYPNDTALKHAQRLFDAARLELHTDERRRFEYRMAGQEDAHAMAASLYLPGDDGGRQARAERFLTGLARRGVGMPIPIRRMVALSA